MGGDQPGSARGLRLAELLAAVSLATDLAHDVAAESALRDAVLAVGLARLMGWTDWTYRTPTTWPCSTTSVVRARWRRRAGSVAATT